MKYTDICNIVQSEISEVLNSIDENSLNEFIDTIIKSNKIM